MTWASDGDTDPGSIVNSQFTLTDDGNVFLFVARKLQFIFITVFGLTVMTACARPVTEIVKGVVEYIERVPDVVVS